MEVLKVSTKSDTSKVAGAITNQIKENGKSEIQVIGAGALNQAMKAIIIARGFLVPSGIEIKVKPSFTTMFVENENRTGMKLIIEEEK